MSRSIRSMILALALLVLCSSASYAFSSGGWLSQETRLTVLWERLVAWFLPESPVSPEVRDGFEEKEGSSMDPNGVSSPVLALYGGGVERSGIMEANGNK